MTSLQYVDAFSPTTVCFEGEQNREGYGPQHGQYLHNWGGVVIWWLNEILFYCSVYIILLCKKLK